jgi:hypothetical protein
MVHDDYPKTAENAHESMFATASTLPHCSLLRQQTCLVAPATVSEMGHSVYDVITYSHIITMTDAVQLGSYNSCSW